MDGNGDAIYKIDVDKNESNKNGLAKKNIRRVKAGVIL
jgi:hypothetical protein